MVQEITCLQWEIAGGSGWFYSAHLKEVFRRQWAE